jgi:hypothetical protein
MSDSQVDSRLKQAIVYIEDKPHFELAGEEWIFPIPAPPPLDERLTMYCHMSPYLAHEVKRFYDQMIPVRRQRTASEVSLETPVYSDACDCVISHFIRMWPVALPDGTEPTPERQAEWIASDPGFAIRIFRLGYDVVGYSGQDNLAPLPAKAVLLFGKIDHQIPTELRLYSFERKRIETLRLDHHLERFNESDRHQYDRAIQLIENSRRAEQRVETNWDVISGLYDRRVKSLEGAVINSQPCQESNKADWIPKVPFIMKAYVVSKVAGAIALGNA